MTQDQAFLHQYITQGSRQALDELIRRHLDLVYSSALRQVRDTHLAEDVTQAVFLILAQKAKSIRDGVAVAGWLLAVTRRTAVDAMRRKTLDRRHEHAIAKPELAPAEAAPWEQIAPVLDAALNRLPRQDRDAVVLRVLENQSLAQVGAELGVSEDAATKRVTRALSRLRSFLQGHGISTGAAALSATLAARAVHAAPPHLLAATLAGVPSAFAATIAKGALSASAWSTAKIAAGIVIAFLLASTGGAMVLSYALSKPSIQPAKAPTLAASVDIAKAPEEPQPADPAAFSTVDLVTEPTESPIGARLILGESTALPRVRSVSTGMAADAMGNVYAVGMLPPLTGGPGSARGIAREKEHGQSKWTNILDLPAVIHCVAVDATGNLYVGSHPWSISKRPAGQRDFLETPIDQPIGIRATTQILGLATDADGNVYACGAINGHWIVRKQTPGSRDFITVDDFISDISAPPTRVVGSQPRPSNYAGSMTIVRVSGPSAGIYVVGYGLEFADADSQGSPKYTTHALVRKSMDGGTTWATVDDVVGDGPSICADAAGNVYVIETATVRDASDEHAGESALTPSAHRVDHWIVKKSATGNINSWSVIDEFIPLTKDQHANPTAASIDSAGNVYVVGNVLDDKGSSRAIIRSNAGGTWHTLDEYQPPSGLAGLEALAVDSEGRVYAGGWVHGETTGWIVRSAMPTLPKTSIELQRAFQIKSSNSSR